MEMEEKKNELTEAALPVQELPADIPDEVRQKLVRDLNEEATEDLKQDIREAERVVMAIRENAEKGVGIFQLDGKMLDIAFMEGAERTLALAKASGVYKGVL